MFGALARGCLTDLAELNLADNKFSKKGGSAPLAFGQFFATAVALQRVDMSGTRIPPDLLETMLMSLAQNSTAHRRTPGKRDAPRCSPGVGRACGRPPLTGSGHPLTVLLVHNELPAAASLVLGKEIRAMQALVELDLSHNDLPDDMLARIFAACAVRALDTYRSGHGAASQLLMVQFVDFSSRRWHRRRRA